MQLGNNATPRSPPPLPPALPATYPNALKHPNCKLQRHRIPSTHSRKRLGHPEMKGGVSRLALRQGFAQSPQPVDALTRSLRETILVFGVFFWRFPRTSAVVLRTAVPGMNQTTAI